MLIEIIVAIAAIITIVGTGSYILQKVDKTQKPWHEQLVISTGIGFICFTAYAFIVNLLGYGYSYLLALPLLLAIPFTFFGIKNVQKIKEKLKNAVQGEKIYQIVFVLICILFLFGLFNALAPATTATPGPKDIDSLNYHFVIPKIYLEQHSLQSISYIAYDFWPHSIETFYTIPMSLASPISAKLVMLFISIATALALYSFTRRFVKKEQAIFGSAIFLSSSVISLFLGSGYIDVALAFFTILALMQLHSWIQTKKQNDLLICGVFAGFTASVKILGFIPLVIIGLLVLYFAIKNKKITQIIPFVIISAVFAMPWLIRNYLNTGNPIFPLFYEPMKILGITANGTEFYMARFAPAAFESGVGRTALDLLLLPWNLTMNGAAFNGLITPLLLCLAPLFLLSLRNTKEFEKILIVFTALFSIVWFYLYQEARFFYIVLATSAILFGIVITRFPSVEKIAQKAIIFALAITVIITGIYVANAVPAALGFENHTNYLNRTLDTYAPCQFINNNNEVQKVLFYQIEKYYYCDKPFYSNTFYDLNANNAAELSEKLKRDGVTHILAPTNITNEAPLMPELINESQAIYIANSLVLYKLS